MEDFIQINPEPLAEVVGSPVQTEHLAALGKVDADESGISKPMMTLYLGELALVVLAAAEVANLLMTNGGGTGFMTNFNLEIFQEVIKANPGLKDLGPDLYAACGSGAIALIGALIIHLGRESI